MVRNENHDDGSGMAGCDPILTGTAKVPTSGAEAGAVSILPSMSISHAQVTPLQQAGATIHAAILNLEATDDPSVRWLRVVEGHIVKSALLTRAWPR